LRNDLRRALRRIRPEKPRSPLTRRADRDLIFAADAPLGGPPLLLDTTVYIDTLEGSTPAALDALLSQRALIHMSVAIGELSHNFGRLDPAHPNTQAALRELRQVVEAIPDHRVETAAAGTVLEAGLLAGLLCRLAGLARGAETAALNDATIYLHALARGYAVVTRNLRDFDWLNQLVPAGRVIFYRQTP
jgi:predicted nucleic acid-binding protein